jgi:hypothetical protein
VCNSVLDGGTIYETPRELARLVGMDGLVWREKNPFAKWPAGKDWHDLDLCLCGIDIPASLSQVGLRCERMTADPMEFEIVR